MGGSIKEILVGGVAVAALLLVVFLSYVGEGVNTSSAAEGYSIKTVFNRVDGLAEGDEVHLGGIPVGRVETMRLDEHYRAVVNLRIDPGVKLPLDTSAAIHTDGLFGAKFVVLEPGGSLDNFKDGGEIEYTQDAVIVSELLELIIAEGKANRKAAAEDAADK